MNLYFSMMIFMRILRMVISPQQIMALRRHQLLCHYLSLPWPSHLQKLQLPFKTPKPLQRQRFQIRSPTLRYQHHLHLASLLGLRRLQLQLEHQILFQPHGQCPCLHQHRRHQFTASPRRQPPPLAYHLIPLRLARVGCSNQQPQFYSLGVSLANLPCQLVQPTRLSWPVNHHSSPQARHYHQHLFSHLSRPSKI